MKSEIIIGIILAIICAAVTIWGFWFENISGGKEQEPQNSNSLEETEENDDEEV